MAPSMGPLLWQLQRRFKIKPLNEDGAFIEYWLSPAHSTLPENWGNLDPISNFVQVKKAPAAVAWQDFGVEKTVGCVHVNPEIAI
jgi:hypothetical protein